MEKVTEYARASDVCSLTAGDWKQMEISAISQVKDAKRLLAAAETLYSRARSMVNSFGQETEQDLADRQTKENLERTKELEAKQTEVNQPK